MQRTDAERKTVDARSLPCEGRVASRFYPRKSFANTLAFLRELARERPGIAHFKLFRRRFYLVDDAELIRDVLVTQQQHFVKSRGARVLSRLLGEGLITSEAPLHVRQRRLVQPAFARARVAAYGEVMVNETLAMLARWRDGETRDVAAEMTRVALAIAGKTLFGSDMLDAVETVREALTAIMELFPKAMGPLGPLYDRLPLPSTLRFLAEVRRLDRTVSGIIAGRRGTADSGDLLSMLLRSQDEEGGMSDRRIRDEALTIVLAGHETTATAFTWAFDALAREPRVEAALHAELDRVLAGRPPSVGDLPRLPYTLAVFSEVLRLYPPVWFIGRRALGDVLVGRYRIPAGAVVILSPFVTHRNPRYYDEPEAFRPERWPLEDLPKFAFFPFGGGARVCIGEQFAWNEGVLVLATIAQRFRCEAGAEHVGFAPFITLRPDRPVRMRLSARKPA